ncbi:MBL fold metallo-hydrolase [Paracoccus sp. PARArs4]|uniref:MBL fold metallo-hydrolase n=1 Tax=Paracoccus sp. PARArs4 TaxID=2853442 RepID=UPI0024A697CE|nr:MBL fold metallo-hydrolase [Paracoccus sp. PARArs4]
MDSVKILSGMGVKGPACIRLDVGGMRLILDCGTGPDEGADFDPAWLAGADAVLITHDHVDHIGGARHAVAAGLPIHATRQTAALLPAGADLRLLPERGVTRIAGVDLTTGRNGHAAGGVWMHFDMGEGLFYSGDWSEESDWFAFDPPPPAGTAILDCSYGGFDVAQSDCIADLDDLLEVLPGQVLLPVPPSGRAAELALRLIRRHGPGSVMVDDACLPAIAHLPEARGLASATEARFLVCDTPNAEAGAAWRHLRAWRDAGRLGQDAHVVFTGHMNAHARGFCDRPGGHFRRWNVHPPLRDQRRMLERLAARRFAPAFCPDPEIYLALDMGAQVFMHQEVTP